MLYIKVVANFVGNISRVSDKKICEKIMTYNENKKIVFPKLVRVITRKIIMISGKVIYQKYSIFYVEPDCRSNFLQSEKKFIVKKILPSIKKRVLILAIDSFY